MSPAAKLSPWFWHVLATKVQLGSNIVAVVAVVDILKCLCVHCSHFEQQIFAQLLLLVIRHPFPVARCPLPTARNICLVNMFIVSLPLNLRFSPSTFSWHITCCFWKLWLFYLICISCIIFPSLRIRVFHFQCFLSFRFRFEVLKYFCCSLKLLSPLFF